MEAQQGLVDAAQAHIAVHRAARDVTLEQVRKTVAQGASDVAGRGMSAIGDAIARMRAHLEAVPEDATGPDAEASATVEGGLRCIVRGPSGQELVSDMVPAVGGAGSAPTPGWLLRAAHAACDATVIAMRAAEEGVTLSTLEVTVESRSDSRGLLGPGDDAPAGPLVTRVRVRISAPGVPEERLRAIVDWARAHSPVDDAVRRAVPMEHEVIVGG